MSIVILRLAPLPHSPAEACLPQAEISPAFSLRLCALVSVPLWRL
jgi:hypothetical protein